MSDFVKELSAVINRHSKENETNTPDFILAEYMNDCLEAYTKLDKKRTDWYANSAIPEGAKE